MNGGFEPPATSKQKPGESPIMNDFKECDRVEDAQTQYVKFALTVKPNDFGKYLKNALRLSLQAHQKLEQTAADLEDHNYDMSVLNGNAGSAKAPQSILANLL